MGANKISFIFSFASNTIVEEMWARTQRQAKIKPHSPDNEVSLVSQPLFQAITMTPASLQQQHIFGSIIAAFFIRYTYV